MIMERLFKRTKINLFFIILSVELFAGYLFYMETKTQIEEIYGVINYLMSFV